MEYFFKPFRPTLAKQGVIRIAFDDALLIIRMKTIRVVKQ